MTVSAIGAATAAESPASARRLLSGVDTLGEVLVARRALDERRGLDTATFVSGYPGSPLGTFDLALGRLGDRLAAARIVHQPGLNEELAAAAVWGSQMGGAVPYDGLDGVVGAWYGKGPGLDRCGDVLKHANMMGTGPGGGAVLFVGDDPSAKSSTLPYDTNLALADASVPVLVPADQQDLFDLGLAAFGLSRFCGSWVGLRIVTAVADGVGTVDTGADRIDRVAPADPEVRVAGERWRHEPVGRILGGDLEELWLDRRLRAAQGWVAALGLDRLVGAPRPGAVRHRVRRQGLPRRARRPGGVRRRRRRPGRGRRPHPQAGDDLPDRPRPAAGAVGVGRRDPGDRGEAALRRAAGAGRAPRGGAHDPGVGQARRRPASRWCRSPAS